MALNLTEFRFLIVDDLREVRMSLRAMLEALRVTQISEARNVDEALATLKAQSCDVVLCDYNLNDTRDGQQLFEEARGRGLLPAHAAWLMITAEQTMGMVMGVVENNPDGYLVKPINKAVLQTRLERTLARKLITREVETALRKERFQEVVTLADAQLARVPQLKGEFLRLKSEALLRLGEFGAVLDLCHGWLNERQDAGASPIETSWAQIALGRAQFELGDLRQSRQVFQGLIERAPTVMEAYDWLARVERESGDGKAAQRVLAQGLGVSPRALRRHQALGDVAIQNGDYATAEKAFEKVMQLGEDSCYSRPEDAVGLLSAVRETKGLPAALKGLAELNKRASRRRGVRETHWQMHALESTLLVDSGKPEEAREAANRALEGFRSDYGQRDNAAILRLAKACFTAGLDEEARGLVDRVVRENHDHHGVLESVRAMFNDLGRVEDGAALIAQAQAEVIRINNEGVTLAKGGRYREAVSLLRKAAEELPNSLTVQLNVLQALMLQMQAEGAAHQTRYLAREHLMQVEKLAPRAEKVLAVKDRLRAFLQGEAG